MTTLFYPFGHSTGGYGHGHGHGPRHGAHPLWAMFGDEQPRTCSSRRSCRGPGPRARCDSNTKPATAAQVPVCDPEEFLTTAAALANAFLPAYFQVVGGTGTEAPKKESTDVAPTKTAFEVKVNVSEFAPAELSVRTVGSTILVEGKHAEREDELGFVSRSFSRRFVIPEDVKAENVTCKLTSDGFLVISAPVVVLPPVTNERAIPITLSSSPAEAPSTPAPVPQEKEAEVKASSPEEAGNPAQFVFVENVGDEEMKVSSQAEEVTAKPE